MKRKSDGLEDKESARVGGVSSMIDLEELAEPVECDDTDDEADAEWLDDSDAAGDEHPRQSRGWEIAFPSRVSESGVWCE